MESANMESRRSYVVGVRHRSGQDFVHEQEQAAEVAGNGNGKPSAESHAMATHSDSVDESGTGLHVPLTASDLETHLVRAIAARTNGRIQALRVQVLGGGVVLHGFAESYHAIQLAVAGLLETFKAMDLDHPGRIDLDIDVLPYRRAQPQAMSVRPKPRALTLTDKRSQQMKCLTCDVDLRRTECAAIAIDQTKNLGRRTAAGVSGPVRN